MQYISPELVIHRVKTSFAPLCVSNISSATINNMEEDNTTFENLFD